MFPTLTARPTELGSPISEELRLLLKVPTRQFMYAPVAFVQAR
jgi:hypothetical protein